MRAGVRIGLAGSEQEKRHGGEAARRGEHLGSISPIAPPGGDTRPGPPARAIAPSPAEESSHEKVPVPAGGATTVGDADLQGGVARRNGSGVAPDDGGSFDVPGGARADVAGELSVTSPFTARRLRRTAMERTFGRFSTERTRSASVCTTSAGTSARCAAARGVSPRHCARPTSEGAARPREIDRQPDSSSFGEPRRQ
jgi:hypothetical protein